MREIGERADGAIRSSSGGALEVSSITKGRKVGSKEARKERKGGRKKNKKSVLEKVA